jgi:pilus assembly protein CpaE
MTHTIVIIDESPEARRVIRSALEPLGVMVLAETDSLIYGYELVRRNLPDVVFVDLRPETLEMVNRIALQLKTPVVFVSGQDGSLPVLKACMHAGVREFLPRPLQAAEVQAAYNSFMGALVRQDTPTGTLITVFSNKGGLGKTTITVNLALALSEVTQKPVAVVDLNLQLGDITTFLNLVPKQTIVDVCQNIGRVDSAYLKSSLAHFQVGNAELYVLADPLQVEDAEEVTAEQINTLLTVLKSTFEYVIVDTPNVFDSRTLTAVDLADVLLLVSTVNLPSIRSTQRLLSLFRRLNYPEQKLRLIINRYATNDEITVEDVEETLEHPVYWKIPNAYQVVMSAINRGIPIQTVANSEAISQSFRDFARKLSGVVLAPHTASPGKSKSFLAGLFGKS